MMAYAWLIPVLPLVAFVMIVFFGVRLKEKAAYVAIGSIGASFLITLVTGYEWFFVVGAGEPVVKLFAWAPTGADTLRMGFTIDSLSVVMLFVVTIVSLMVEIFSIGYMHGDERYPRFFAYLSLFTASMLSLVIANTLLLMYISWELVGLTSYLLIGFWFQKPEAMRAAKKAFLVTRVGDVGFFLGLLIIYKQTASVELTKVFEAVKAGIFNSPGINWQWAGAAAAVVAGIAAYGFAAAALARRQNKIPAAVAAALVVFGIVFWLIGGKTLALSLGATASVLIFWGAVGKSAQFPLHVWLPDAMEGPTPVSALIHAATMVAAGVYLVARMYPLFIASEPALSVVAVVGAFTAVFAATMGLVMNDIKRVLAYSTISQLGYMMMGLGVGGYAAGMFHLMTHAFFKANLFLGSGSVIHGTGTQDIRRMGGLWRRMPWTFGTFIVATAALAGLPPTAGFFSKDEILLAAYHWHGGKVIFYAGVAGAFLTACYMTRLVVLTFFGKPRDPEVHAHESWKVMTVPLVVLATLSLVAGFVGAPWKNLFGHYLTLESLGMHVAEHHFSWVVAGFGFSAAALGILLGLCIWYWSVVKLAVLKPALGWLQTMVENKYYMDDMYDIVVIKPLMLITRAAFAFDRWVIDYVVVNGVGWITLICSRFWGLFDKYVVDGLVNLIGLSAKIGGRILRFVQTGVVQQYAIILVISLLIMGWYFVLR